LTAKSAVIAPSTEAMVSPGTRLPLPVASGVKLAVAFDCPS